MGNHKLLARRYVEEIWNKGSPEAIEALCDPAFEGRDPLFGAYRRDGLGDAVKAYRSAFPDLKLEIVNIITEGNLTAVRWIARGTNLGAFMGQPATGKRTSVTGVDVTEVRDGRVVSDVIEYDALGLLRQLGADPRAMPLPVTRKAPEVGRHA